MNIPAYPSYRQVDASWLEAVPEHWRLSRQRFVAALNPPSPYLRGLTPETEVSFVPMEAVGELGGLDLEVSKAISDRSTGYTEFENGDVVIAKITPCFENGKGAFASGLLHGVALGTTELHVLRPTEGVDGRFLFYVSISAPFRAFGEANMHGAAGQKRITKEFVKDFVLPVPPPQEQRSIADFLDRETSRIDSLVTKKREFVERLAERRATLITEVATHGLPSKAARATRNPALLIPQPPFHCM